MNAMPCAQSAKGAGTKYQSLILTELQKLSAHLEQRGPGPIRPAVFIGRGTKYLWLGKIDRLPRQAAGEATLGAWSGPGWE